MTTVAEALFWPQDYSMQYEATELDAITGPHHPSYFSLKGRFVSNELQKSKPKRHNFIARNVNRTVDVCYYISGLELARRYALHARQAAMKMKKPGSLFQTLSFCLGKMLETNYNLSLERYHLHGENGSSTVYAKW